MSSPTKVSFPYECKDLDENFAKIYPVLKDRYTFVGPKNFCLFSPYKDVAETLYNFEARPEDVWVLGMARSGTTLAQEMIWLLGNDLDYEKATQELLAVRFPSLENAAAFTKQFGKYLENPEKYSEKALEAVKKLMKPTWEVMAETTGKRFIKTHVPISLGPKNLLKSGCKIVYVARNPKDVAVSMFNLFSTIAEIDIQIDFEESWNHFQQGLSISTPYFEHLKEAWQIKSQPNVFFMFYEDYTKDLKTTIKNLAKFLEKPITEEQAEVLENHLKIDNFRKNQAVNNQHFKELGLFKSQEEKFIRKGKVGGWRDYFNDNLNAQANKWIRENLKDTDIELPPCW